MGAIEYHSNNEIKINIMEQILLNIIEADSDYMGRNTKTANYPSLTYLNYFNDTFAEHKDILGIFDEALRKLERRLK